jgi:hypothetical protein
VTEPKVRKVVFAPNLIAAALLDPFARRVLERWRDGEFIVVINRELLSAHLRELKRIGLPPHLIKRWAYWLSSPEKTDFLQHDLPPQKSLTTLCETLAKISGATAIICCKLPVQKSASMWKIAKTF